MKKKKKTFIKSTLTIHKIIRRYPENVSQDENDTPRKLKVKWWANRKAYGTTWAAYPVNNESDSFYEYPLGGYITSFPSVLEKIGSSSSSSSGSEKEKFEDRHVFFYLYEYKNKWEKIASCNFNFVRELSLEKPLRKDIPFTFHKKNLFSRKEKEFVTVLHFSIISTMDEEKSVSNIGSDIGSDIDDSDLSELDKINSAKNLKPLVVVPTQKESKGFQTEESMESVKKKIVEKEAMIEQLKSMYDSQVNKYKDQIFKKQINFKEREQTDYRRIRSLLDENSTLKRTLKEQEQRNGKLEMVKNKKISKLKNNLVTITKTNEKLKNLVNISKTKQSDTKERMKILKQKYLNVKMELQQIAEDKQTKIKQLEEEKDENERIASSTNAWQASAVVLSVLFGFISVFVVALEAKENYSFKFYMLVLLLFSCVSYFGFFFGKSIKMQSSMLLPGSITSISSLKTFTVQGIIYGTIFGFSLPFISKYLRSWFSNGGLPTLIESFNKNKTFSVIIIKVFVDVFVSDVLLRLFTFSLIYYIVILLQMNFTVFKKHSKMLYSLVWLIMGILSGLYGVYISGWSTIEEIICFSFLGMFLSYMFWVIESIEFVMYSHIIALSMYYYLYSLFLQQ